MDHDPQHTEPSTGEPQSIEHMVGQFRVIDQVRTALDAFWNERAMAARPEKVALPHMLMVGPPGLGKTQIAQIIAKEIAVPLHETLAQNLTNTEAVNGFMVGPADGEIAFLDELHTASKAVQTALYRAMEERRVFAVNGSGKGQMPISICNFSLFGATTDEHGLLSPLRDRFKLILRFEYYNEAQLAELTRRRAIQRGWKVHDDVLWQIALKGRGTPRIALRLLESARRVSQARAADEVTLGDLHRAIELDGLDEVGLDLQEQQYLRILADADGEPLRLNVLATRLGLPRKTVNDVIESYLIRLGLVIKSDKGRMLTRAGIEHVRGYAK